MQPLAATHQLELQERTLCAMPLLDTASMRAPRVRSCRNVSLRLLQAAQRSGSALGQFAHDYGGIAARWQFE